MNTTGTWASDGVAFRRRQLSNPSRPGITASISTRSGVTLAQTASAASPPVATSAA